MIISLQFSINKRYQVCILNFVARCAKCGFWKMTYLWQPFVFRSKLIKFMVWF